MIPNEIDIFEFDALLSDEERQVRDAVRRWVNERFRPLINQHHSAGTFPTELVPEMGELGLFGPALPEQYGCAGLSSTAYGVMMRELERCDSGLRSFASVQGSLVMWPIYTYGSEEQRQSWLPRLASGEAIGCFGLTEPDHGSNPGGMITRAKKTENGWLLNGAKMWITNSPLADVSVVWAKVEEEEGTRYGGFLVEKDRPGFSAPEIKGKWSLRASVTGEIVLDNVEIPTENELPNTPGSLKGPLGCLTQARYGISWGAVGAAMDCLDSARRYSLERSQFGKPIASFQLVQAKLAHMAVEITKAQGLAWRLGALKDAGTFTPVQVSLAKLNNVDCACEAARLSREIHGAMGITEEYSLMRHMMNLESVKTYEGTNDIHALTLGRYLTGISAFA